MGRFTEVACQVLWVSDTVAMCHSSDSELIRFVIEHAVICVRAQSPVGRNYQGLYRPWKVLEFYCSEFQAWKVLEKGIGPGKPWEFLESPGILKQSFWIFLLLFWVVAKQIDISNTFQYSAISWIKLIIRNIISISASLL